MRSLKKLVSLLCCLSIVFSLVLNVSAEDYKKVGKDVKDKDKGTATFYVIDGDAYESLFKMDVSTVKDWMAWIFNYKSFTVIKKYKDKNGKVTYKGYFNSPNLQQYLKNSVTSEISDGYIDETYNVDETQWIVDVGKKAKTKNAITKYGFKINSPFYSGEYPNVTMNMMGVLTTAWVGGPWTVLKSAFTGSFVDAPSSTEFNTLTYLNHTYSDSDEFLVEFIQKYWIKYFVARIVAEDDDLGKASQAGYFKNADNLKLETVTDEENASAERFIEENKVAVAGFLGKKAAYIKWKDGSSNITIFTGDKIKSNPFKYNNHIKNIGLLGYATIEYPWNGITIPVGHNRIEAPLVSLGNFKIYTNSDEAKEIWNSWIEARQNYIKKIQDWWGGGKNTSKIRLLYSIAKKNSLLKDLPKTYSDSDVKNYFDKKINSESVTTQIEFINAMFMQENLSGDYYYYDGYGRTDDGLKKYPVEFGKASKVTYNKKQSKKGKDGKTVLEDVKGKDGKVIKITETWKPANHKFYFIDNNKDYEIDYGIVEGYYKLCLMNYTGFTLDDWLPSQAQAIIDKYNECVELTIKYDKFIDKFKSLNNTKGYKANGNSMTGILYSQCLIKSSDSGKCISREKGDEASYNVANVYVYSGIYRDTPGFNFKDFFNTNGKTGYWTKYPNVYINRETLTKEQANKIIDDLRNKCTVYYSEVMANIVKIMILNAKSVNDAGPSDLLNVDDPRVMPYDVMSLNSSDASNYAVADPRAEMGREHAIGFAVDELNVGGIEKFFAYFRPQLSILQLTGTITEFSVWMQSLCNFNVLESLNENLSPATFWGIEGFAVLLLATLALYFIIKTIAALIKFCGGNGTARDTKIFASFLILIIELGCVTFVYLHPKTVWEKVKTADTYLINAGEIATVYSNPNMQYLFGNKGSFEVTYYLPYLDAWSLYNTGYGLMDPKQIIDTNSKSPELAEFNCPQIDGKDIKHWSVLLADSFEYHGDSHSIMNGIYDNDNDNNKRLVNGKNINKNAYRVVDHFLAPRVTFTEKENGAKMQLSVAQNENYNGKFQKEFFDLIVKLALSLLMCFLSLVKLLTFLWQWYLIYVFFFKVILGKMAEKKGWTEILLTTFMPTIAMFFIGLYNGTVLQIGMTLSGFAGLIIIIGFFIISFRLLGWWYKLKGGAYFPLTLKPIYIITNKTAIEEMMKNRRKREASELDDDFGSKSLEEQYAYFYDKNGIEKDTMKSETKQDRLRRAMLMDRLVAEKNNDAKFRNTYSKTDEGKDMIANADRIIERYKQGNMMSDDIAAWRREKLRLGGKIDGKQDHILAQQQESTTKQEPATTQESATKVDETPPET